MRLSIIAFTEAGSRLCRRLVPGLIGYGYNTEGWIPERYLAKTGEALWMNPFTESVETWTREQFGKMDGIIYIGAAGIAVRAIAPYIKDKWSDPAVVVMDDQGRFSISLLSGHVGGANELARQAADSVGAIHVVTTATDGRGKFAVDLYAKNHGLWLSDRKLAKLVSADILDGKTMELWSDFPVEGDVPEELHYHVGNDAGCGYPPEAGCLDGEGYLADCRDSSGSGKQADIRQRGIWITTKCRLPDAPGDRQRLDGQADILRLVPRITALGIGCRKNTPAETIRQAVFQVLKEENLSPRSVAAVVSVDLKKKEKGLKELAGMLDAEWKVYSAAELASVTGDFTPSQFVKKVTGVDNVCERAAALWVSEHGGGKLAVKKRALSGVTVAAAVREWKAEF